jgi:6-phosphogluconolactonase
MTVHCYPAKRECCEALAEKIVEISTAALLLRPSFSIVLAGGSTPRALYRLLASREWRHRIVWARTHIFFGDERCVPPDHPDSNYRMAREALFRRLDIADHQIHRIYGENRADSEAVRYQAVIEAYFRTIALDEPLFDLTLLGLGSDGHTASLFPGDQSLHHRGLVTAVPAPLASKPAVARVSLTPEGIGKARNICFFVDGEAKAAIVAAVLAGGPLQYPAAMVQGKTSDWYLSGMDCQRFLRYH